ncbi:MAG TPA: molybdopterin molybdotransferase MoeA [Planctomycetota bacterium]|jgi:molybdopterin molybdotransferase
MNAAISLEVTPQTALHELLSRIQSVGTEDVRWREVAGRVLAEPIVSDRPSPSCDVSAMDGYAARIADLETLARSGLPVRGCVTAGTPAGELQHGTAMKAMTGAMLPAGAEVVIRREDILEEGGERVRLRPGAAVPEFGQDIRRRGENLRQNQHVLAAGIEVSSVVAGALACFGQARVRVYRRVRVATLVTGDELRTPEEQPEDWQLRDTNGPALRALLGRCPWAEHVIERRICDRRELLQQAVQGALEQCDALILSGGVSMGDCDYVPSVVQSSGAEIVFHKLPIRPGKPVLSAIGRQGQLILGLPGNPVSSLVTMRRFGVPALRARAGFCKPAPHVSQVLLDPPDAETLKLWWYRLVSLGENGSASLVSNHGSGDLVASARADGFIEVPPGQCGPGPWPFYQWL